MARQRYAVLLPLFLLVAPALAQVQEDDVVAAEEKVDALEGKGTTPIKKVMKMIKKLGEQIEEEGKKEAAQYDKYACFCKEQADQKLYQIEKSEKLLEKLGSKIQKLDSEISSLNQEIAERNKAIDELTDEIKQLTKERATEHEKYLEAEADLSTAIEAAANAIKVLQESKEDLEGDVDKNAFLQVQEASRKALALASVLAPLDEKSLVMLNTIAKVGAPGQPVVYTYQSNDIISMLVDLKGKFTDQKKQVDADEFNRKSVFDSKVLGLSNEKQFEEKERDVKEKIVAEKSAILSETEADHTREELAHKADSSFLEELTSECQEKAQLWDQRSRMRADELTALSQVLEALETGVAPNEGANKKLVGLQMPAVKKTQRKGHWEWLEEPASFLQMRRSLRGAGALSATALKKQIANMLLDASRNLKSSHLAMVAARVLAEKDRFAKVRSLIKDLIDRLEFAAKEEERQKAFCDKSMKETLEFRDKSAAAKEHAAAEESRLKSEFENLMLEVDVLGQQIAQLEKAYLEALELRKKENEDNTATINAASEGKEAVEYCLKILNDFYGSFLQTGKYVPPNADREGNTVGDVAPDIFDKPYEGQKDSSGGIIGMLEVILSDFDRTVTTVSQEEKLSEEEFLKFEKDTHADIEAKESDKEAKWNEMQKIGDDMHTAAKDLDEANKAHKSAIEELEHLSKLCVQQEESYEDRVEKREKEIEALKEALNILENWKGDQ